MKLYPSVFNINVHTYNPAITLLFIINQVLAQLVCIPVIYLLSLWHRIQTLTSGIEV